MKLNLSKEFQALGVRICSALYKGVENNVAIDGSAYSKPEESTLKARRVKRSAKTGKILGSSSSIKRLRVTGDFAREAFAYKSSESGVTVYALNKTHRSGEITYADILRYNSKGQDKVNRNIKVPPLVFPTNNEEIKMLLKNQDVAHATSKLIEEAGKQLKQMGILNVKVRLNIG